jgi:hypothetical protein
MKARDVSVGMTIRATPFMEEPIEGLVENVRHTPASGGGIVWLRVQGYQAPFSFRGSSYVKVIKNEFK